MGANLLFYSIVTFFVLFFLWDSFLELDREMLPIIPGMVADVNIVHGKKTILQYLINPVLKLRENAFRER
ncbi:hypothetical protein [Emcibacter sp.]|uniref:hypothetical protein n=1 Tax=Emcibacter sp. TaxID=1979954 RepID=UPI003A906A52